MSEENERETKRKRLLEVAKIIKDDVRSIKMAEE